MSNNFRRGGIAGRKRKNKISEQFVYYTRDMIDSPAYRALSLQARKVLRRLELEHMAHGTMASCLAAIMTLSITAAGKMDSARR